MKRIKADPKKQRANNSYDPPLYYEDRKFTCKDCGAKEVWTAEQQRWWYEVWRGPIYAVAVRCRPCRQKLRRAKLQQKKHMEEMATRKQLDWPNKTVEPTAARVTPAAPLRSGSRRATLRRGSPCGR